MILTHFFVFSIFSLKSDQNGISTHRPKILWKFPEELHKQICRVSLRI